MRTVRLDRFPPDADLARGLAEALRINEGGITHVRGWDEAFSGREGPDRLYRFNLLRETVFAPRAAQIWWMTEAFRDSFMQHAPDTWSFMRLRLTMAESDEYIELPATLARLVRPSLGLTSDAPIPRTDFLGLTRLDASFSRLTSEDLDNLTALKSLKVLNLMGSKVSDICPLSSLQSLEELNLNGTLVSDVSPLSGCVALKELQLWKTKVVDLSPISGLSNLLVLALTATKVTDIRPLMGLAKLQVLFLDGTLVSDISPLSALSDLRVLFLGGTQVSSLSPLKGLAKLSTVNLPNGGLWSPRHEPLPEIYRT